MATGQAAGTAASIAARNNISTSAVNIKALREILINQGAYI